MRGVVAVLTSGVLAVGVGGLPGDASASPLASPRCGATTVQTGGPLPGWTASAAPPGDVPFALSERRDATAILFGAPLRAGHPTSHNNKILWIMREPRDGQPLHLTARPLRRSAPTVRVREPAESGPGEIYPSVLDVPRSGCWHVTLDWSGHRDAIDLRYR